VRRLGSQASSKLAYLGSYIKCSERELLPVSGQSLSGMCLPLFASLLLSVSNWDK
jgi:hypothetical protein